MIFHCSGSDDCIGMSDFRGGKAYAFYRRTGTGWQCAGSTGCSADRSGGKKAGVKRCIVPEANEAEGALVKGIEIIGVKHLKQITKILSGERKKKSKESSQKQTVKIRSRIF